MNYLRDRLQHDLQGGLQEELGEQPRKGLLEDLRGSLGVTLQEQQRPELPERLWADSRGHLWESAARGAGLCLELDPQRP